jgi:AmiR/NasT family two-component response regulator
VVLTTAEPDESELLEEARALGVAAIVKKPWSPQALRTIVQKIIEPPAG